MKITTSQNGFPVLEHNNVFGTKGVASAIVFQDGFNELKERAIGLIRESYSPEYMESAIADLTDAEANEFRRIACNLAKHNDLACAVWFSHLPPTIHDRFRKWLRSDEGYDNEAEDDFSMLFAENMEYITDLGDLPMWHFMSWLFLCDDDITQEEYVKIQCG